MAAIIGDSTLIYEAISNGQEVYGYIHWTDRTRQTSDAKIPSTACVNTALTAYCDIAFICATIEYEVVYARLSLSVNTADIATFTNLGICSDGDIAIVYGI